MRLEGYIVFMDELPDRLKGVEGLSDEGKIYVSGAIFNKIKHKHHLEEDVLEDIKKAIYNPVAIFRSTADKVIVVTDIRDYENRPVIALIACSEKENIICSVYGRNNMVNYMRHQVEENSVLFVDLDKLERIKDKRSEQKMDEIRRQVLEAKGCKLKMTVERDGRKIELSEKEIWAAYELVKQNLTPEVEETVKEISRSLG